MELPDFSKVKIAVIGDVMLDVYIFGNSDRISPESPVPVVHINKMEKVLGGAGNVANNLFHLGCDVTLFGLIGDDLNGNILKEITNFKNHFYTVNSYKTISKSRVLANNQQIVRIDDEQKNFQLSKTFEDTILKNLKKEINKFDAIILSDYGKGCLSEYLVSQIIFTAKRNNVKVFVDPKGTKWNKYSGATCITPNLNEIQKINIQENDLELFSKELIDQLELDSLLVTMGSDGMVLFQKNNKTIYEEPEQKTEIFDVSGAGDTVISTFVACIISKISIEKSIKLANIAAGVVIQKIGTCPIHKIELYEKLLQLKLQENKLVQFEDMVDLIQIWKMKNYKLVFTNGCFDLLHSGHIDLLKESATFGDKLIIGLNSDLSIKKIKGDNRPIIKEEDRIKILSSLEFVDLIVLFNDETPIKLIEMISPDVLIKGGDYKNEQIIGNDFVQSYKGQVLTIPFKTNISTTKIINKIQNGDN